jgi:hypothetical protein
MAVDWLVLGVERDNPKLFLLAVASQPAEVFFAEPNGRRRTGDPCVRPILRFQLGNTEPNLNTRHKPLDSVSRHSATDLKNFRFASIRQFSQAKLFYQPMSIRVRLGTASPRGHRNQFCWRQIQQRSVH